MNLYGAPAMTPKEFASYQHKTIVGVSLTVAPPLGQYDPTKLINLGTNRWSFKPEVGFSQARGKWVVEAMAGVWLFTDNTNFFGGSTREQDPIVATQFHLTYKFQRTMWLAADANYFTGGRTTIGGRQNLDLQRNSRIGATFSTGAQSPERHSHVGEPRRIHDDRREFHLDRRRLQLRVGALDRRRRDRVLNRKDRHGHGNGGTPNIVADHVGPEPVVTEPADFSLVLGGPLYQLWRRSHLAGDALQLLHRRIVVLTALAWVPLLALSVAEGHAWGGSVALPFLYDIETARAPSAGAAAARRRGTGRAPAHAPGRRGSSWSAGLIPDSELATFDEAIASAMRLRNSIWVEVLLIAFVYVVGVGIVWRTQMRSRWRAGPARRWMEHGSRRWRAGGWAW